MGRTAPVPNIPPIPGMCPSIAVLAGGGDGGGGSGKGGKGGKGKGPGSGSGSGDGADGDGRDAADPSKYPDCGTESHPVDVVTGRAYTHPIVDFELPGPLPLTFARSWSSSSRSRQSNLGWGWSHTFSWEIHVKRDKLVIWNFLGVSVEFPLLQPGQEILGEWGWVLRAETWGYALDTGDGVWFVFSENAEDHFAGGESAKFKLTAIEDRNKNRIILVYEDGKLAEITDSAGRKLKVTTDPSARITEIAVQNAAQRGQWLTFIRYTYDDRGNMVMARDADDHAWRYEYDDQHRMTKDKDRVGLTFHFVYDEESRCIEAWGDYDGKPDPALAENLPKYLADGVTLAKGIHHCVFVYGGDRSTEVIKSTEVRRYFGNEFGLLDKAIKNGGVEENRYDERGHLIAMSNELGAVTSFSRDPRGRVLSVTGPLGNTVKIARDAAGMPVRFTDQLGFQTVISRDSRGNALTVEHPNGGVTAYQYDSRGLPTQVVLPDGGKWVIQYDAHGNLVRRVQPDGSERKGEYDYLGRLLAEEEGGSRTTYTYSTRGDMISRRNADGLFEQIQYDGEGHVVANVDKRGRVVRKVYGGYHLLCEEQYPDGGVSKYKHDREGHLAYIENPRGERHLLTYDAGGFCIEQRTFDGRTYSMTYDAAGHLTRIVDGLRRTTNLERDITGELVMRELSDGTVETFGYDARGDTVLMTGPHKKIRYERDAMGNIVQEHHVDDQGSWSLEREFDLVGRVIKTKSSLGFEVSRERDPFGSAKKTILGPASQHREINHGFDAAGRETSRVLPSGGRLEFTFDLVGRPSETRVLRRGASIPQPAFGEPDYLGGLTAKYDFHRQYHWDELDQLTSVTLPRDISPSYEYDTGGNLTAIQRSTQRREYKYDAAGARMLASEPTRIGPGGRVVQQGKTTYTWDADGQLVEKSTLLDDGAAVTKFSWTAKGQLSMVTLPNGERLEFSYDACWRRVEKRVYRRDIVTRHVGLSASTRFYWDGDRLAEELTTTFEGGKKTGTSHKRYCFGDASLVPLAHEDVGGEWFHYVNDQAGMPEALLDAEGRVVATLARDEWGSAVMEKGSATSTPIRFVGQYADGETGLAYHRFRYYDPELGTFISADPIGIMGGLEAYAYTPEPLSWVDPLGLTPTRSMALGDQLEEKRKAALRGSGFSIVDTKVGSGNGIDILAVQKDSKGNVISARIEECKTGQSDLATDVDGDKQMSANWKRKKLEAALAEAKTPCQKKAIQQTLDLLDNDPSAVQGVVVHQDIAKDSLGRRKLTGPITQQTATESGAAGVTKGPKGKIKYNKK